MWRLQLFSILQMETKYFKMNVGQIMIKILIERAGRENSWTKNSTRTVSRISTRRLWILKEKTNDRRILLCWVVVFSSVSDQINKWPLNYSRMWAEIQFWPQNQLTSTSEYVPIWFWLDLNASVAYLDKPRHKDTNFFCHNGTKTKYFPHRLSKPSTLQILRVLFYLM